MSDRNLAFSDATLTAYLDGELDPQEAAQIARAIKSDPQLADQVAGLMIPMDALRKTMAVETLAAPKMPAHMLPDGSSARVKPRYWVPAALAASFALGVVLTPLLRPSDDINWTTAVASYQALYVTETLAAPVQPIAAQSAVLARATTEFGVDLSGALALQDLEFKRAQMLGFDGRPLLQVAYLTQDGTPMALCLISVDGPDQAPVSSVNFDLAGVSWTRDGVGYFLVGGQDTATVTALSETFAAVL